MSEYQESEISHRETRHASDSIESRLQPEVQVKVWSGS